VDFRLTQEEEAFRKEVRQFFREELPKGWIGPVRETIYTRDDFWSEHKRMARKLGAKVWLSLSWPQEYGGLARPHMEQIVFNEETAYHRAPGVDGYGVKMLAPTLIFFGTDEQKKQHLGPIARGEIAWCEGYSEPETGSDLASVKTRAVKEGNYYVINGQKLWTTGAHRAQWCFLLARTNPDAPKKHHGLSFFLVDLKTPGITVRSLMDPLGRPCANEVFFENARVPEENLVGGENNGWQVGNALLSFERSGIELVAFGRRCLDDMMGYARSRRVSGRPLNWHPIMRQRLAEMAIESETARLLTYRVAWMQSRMLMPISEAVMAKVFNTELLQRIANTGMQLLELYGPLTEDSPWVQLSGVIAEEYINAQGWTIAGGTSEIMRTVIATSGLNMPRA